MCAVHCATDDKDRGGRRTRPGRDPPAGTFRDERIEALAEIIRERRARPIGRLLVVGCGTGREAAVLAAALDAAAVGIDLVDAAFDPAAAVAVDLRRGDATRLEFADRSFDFVFSYHVLEHIAHYPLALAEMSRVLAAGGGFCIGTPNRLRLVGYLGSRDATHREKLLWNLADWRAMLRGRFRNEFGAHAGFSSAELGSALQSSLGAAEEVTLPYYARLYRKHRVLLRGLAGAGLASRLLPSVYFVGCKAEGGAGPRPRAQCGDAPAGKPSQISRSSTH